jgi:hypothetical protein
MPGTTHFQALPSQVKRIRSSAAVRVRQAAQVRTLLPFGAWAPLAVLPSSRVRAIDMKPS